jgi:anaphase-promoting complex subunit 1
VCSPRPQQMASVTSLGLHQPAGLAYLIQEGLLPSEPASDLYTWQTIPCDDGGGSVDELLATETCVVWCRGGIVRKSFRFEVEGESVSQALLTYFVGKQDRNNTLKKEQMRPNYDGSDPMFPGERFHGEKSQQNPQSRALVVFLKTQAHVYFLSGTSHVIHLPFEVEHAVAAPNGLIIQRKLQADKVVPASLKLPRVPPNSFISSQPQPWSAASSQLSNFSIASLGSPKQLPLPRTASLGDMWDIPTFRDDSHWPRLFSLTDPLAELGLVVTAAKPGGNRRVSIKAHTLDPAEELIHVTNRDEFATIQPDMQDPLILAITLNRGTSMYTVWRVNYVEQEDSPNQRQAVTSSIVGRRRSSFAPSTTTGATTPVSSQYPFRESLGAAGLTIAKTRREENIKEKLDFASTLDPDFETNNVPRRKSRRVSSMLARADLSASHERSAFSELAGHQLNSNRRVDSLSSQHNRSSLSHNANTSGHVHVSGSQMGNNISSFLEAPVDDLLEELRAGGDFEGFTNMGLDDEEFEGLKKEIVFTKIESFAAEYSNARFSNQHKSVQSQCKTFALAAPPFASDDPYTSQIVICILDTEEKKLLVLPLDTKRQTNATQPGLNKRKAASSKMDLITVTSGDVTRASGVLDACKLTDGRVSRILVLTESANGYGELSLQAPWSLMMKVSFPEKLTVTNIRALGHNASSQRKQESDFRRILSQGPHAKRLLRNPLPRGIVDVVDGEGRLHQLRISMEPQSPLVKQVINICRAVLPGTRAGEAILVGWWNVRHWFIRERCTESELEWSALVVVLFSLVLGAQDRSVSLPHEPKKKPRRFPRFSGVVQSDMESWQEMFLQEAAVGCLRPAWMMNSGWLWMHEVGNAATQTSPKGLNQQDILGSVRDEDKFLPRHIRLAHKFVSSSAGQAAFGADGYMPTAEDKSIGQRQKCIADLVVGLHLLREEQKLNITSVDALDTGNISLNPVLGQIFRWLGWGNWAAIYNVEDALVEGVGFDSCMSLTSLLTVRQLTLISSHCPRHSRAV